MKLKIGVMGGAAYEHSKENLERAAAVGKAIAENNCILFYGATIGLPLAAAKAAREAGALVVGVSPAANEKEHREKYKYPTDSCDAVVFTGHGFQGRNVMLVRSCDAIVIIGGRVGTMSEFAVAYAEQKPIGVLLGSGRFADKVAELDKEVLRGEMPTPIVYEKEPKALVEKLLRALRGSRK
ncbi:MAG: LOG family protein [Candidatus Diapherotrites archaeon]|nr:LOG family protein [Candidatus Diapherotrites archaeon]